MIPTIQLLVGLLLVISIIAFIAVRLQVPASILLVLAGVGLALPAALPNVELSPEVVLLLVLPPIIYSAAVAMSWNEFRANLRPISLLAVGCVVFTAAAVAAAAHYWMGFAWQVGFVLGAIISPPDAVAPLSIARRLHLPRRLVVILEGEGIANDATALILYRFAVAAVGGGVFSMTAAVGTFAAIVVGELLWGVAVGWLMLRLRRLVGDPRVEIMLSVLTPFIAYWPPEFLGGSGVLATVTTGLYISWNGLRLISAPTRLQGIFFWDFLIYLIEGMVFLLTGLQARALVAGLKTHTLSELAAAGAIAEPRTRTARSIAALAMAVRACVHRSPRHRLAGGSPRASTYNFRRGAVPEPRSDSRARIRRSAGHVGGAGADTSVGRAGTGSCECGSARGGGTPDGGTSGTQASYRGSEPAPR
jgi:CPA1 family monovalent cation:H+ antiporter